MTPLRPRRILSEQDILIKATTTPTERMTAEEKLLVCQVAFNNRQRTEFSEAEYDQAVKDILDNLDEFIQL